MKPITRRSAVKSIVFGSGVLLLQSCAGGLFRGRHDETNLNLDSLDIGPIDRTLREVAPAIYFGDEMQRAHQSLWGAKKGAFPEPTERVPLVIVGGGISGLASAYLNRAHAPIVLEHAGRLGGNSKAQSWNGADYALGAAYFMEPDEGSALEKFYQDVGVTKLAKKVEGEGSFFFDGKLANDFWSGNTDVSQRKQFKKLKTYFERVLNEENGKLFPTIPYEEKKYETLVKKLDRESFLEHVESVVGGALHPHIRSCMEHYCWSSFGASMSELSAASGLNFYAAEFGDVYVMPGGNAGVAECIYRKLSETLPKENVRTRATVVNVKTVADGAVVSYVDVRGKMKSISAKAVVMACPKFVTKHVLENIEEDRKKAIDEVSYRAYLTANVLLKKPLAKNFYDMYMVNAKEAFGVEIKPAADAQKVTDVINGTYAQPTNDRAILTLYRALPYEGGRAEVFAAESYAEIRKQFEAQTAKEILPALGLAASDIIDLRIARFGHALPVARMGKIADGTTDILRRPFENKVFFVEQDNWMLPAIETSLEEAIYWKDKIAAVL